MCAAATFIPLVPVLETVTAGAVAALADVSDMDLVELAVHSVLVETALRHAARYAAVQFVVHDSSSFLPYYAQFF